MSEILAPCGGLDSVKAAIRCGADAVYVGSKEFSARSGAKNFDREELSLAVRECHAHGVKLYQAVNTLVFDDELDALSGELEYACEIGVDGLIVQDIAVLELLKKAGSDMPAHASTQMTAHTPRGVRILKEMGFSRAVAARELSLEKIKELCQEDIEIEIFVHGALCMSVSGQCFMSAAIGRRSANRGRCAGACRLPFSAAGRQRDRYDLSLKDLSYLARIKELEKAGAASFKIEGRMKRPEYTAACTYGCKKALCGQSPDMELLKSVFSRSGFTDGYLDSELGGGMFGIRRRDDVIGAKDAFPRIRELYKNEVKKYTVDFKAVIKKGGAVCLFARAGEIEVKAEGREAEAAIKKPLTKDAVKAQLERLGTTPYSMRSFECELDEGLSLSASELNALRREAAAKLDEKIIEKNTRKRIYKRPFFEPPEIKAVSGLPKLRIRVKHPGQLDGADLSEIELITVPFEHAGECGVPAERLCVSLPRFIFDEKALIRDLAELKDAGVIHAEASNIAHISFLKELGFKIHGSFGLNISNSLALKAYKDMGLCDAVVSPELTVRRINALSGMDFGVYAYGRLPLMLTVNCPVKAAAGCKNCRREITDRTGRTFKIMCEKKRGYFEILNCDPLVVSDRLDDFKACSFISLDFYSEDFKTVRDIINMYKNKAAPDFNFTRGLYYRGVE